MSHRPNRKKLREAKQRAWEESVAAEAARRPPVVHRVPAPPPVEALRAMSERMLRPQDEPFGWRDVQELNTRPSHRVVARYAMPSTAYQVQMMRAKNEQLSSLRCVEFQAMQHALRVDATDFVWWSWEPRGEALKSEVAYGLRRAQVMVEQMKNLLATKQVVVYGTWNGAEKDFMRFLDIVLEDCAQNLGQP